MNKSNLRSFAVSARNELIERVKQKAFELGITEDKVKKAQIESSDAIYINGKSLDIIQIKQRNSLIQQIKGRSYSQVIEEVAYTWFNRFCALRFMEVNDYLPNGIRVLSSTQAGNVEPDILREALHLTEDLDLDPDLVFELRERKDNNDLFKYLLIKQCNSLNLLLPFLFEKVEDYTEILFPDNLLKEGSILRTMANTEYIPEADWRDVEIIGWLYQYYISEKKDQVFADLKKNIKISPENIPAATQLFTPHWIVRYLVENSLGRLWMLNHPDSRLIEQMDFYIKPVDTEVEYLELSSPEDIKICDPACGSGHMLTYAFDLLYSIYEESGYVAMEIPALILTKNLYGIEIDVRAGQLAAFALTMKAHSRNNIFFRYAVQPNICVLQNIHFDQDELKHYMDEIGYDLYAAKLLSTLSQFEESNNFGSLIRPLIIDVTDALQLLENKNLAGNLFLATTHKKVIKALKQAEYLSPRYCVVIANPPYMGNKGMNGRLKIFLEENYMDVKSDLFSAFIIRNTELALPKAQLGFVTPYVWMFISSYAKLREYLLDKFTITTLAQLEYNAFEPACIPVCTFSIEKTKSPQVEGGYIRLTDFRGIDNQEPKALKAINDPECGWFHRASSSDFKKIPGVPIAYWASEKVIQTFEGEKLSDILTTREGMATANNERFLRLWHEVPIHKISFNMTSSAEATKKCGKWFPYNKGGEFRRWYGNNEFVVEYENDGFNIKTNVDPASGRIRSHNYNGDFAFREGITWSALSSASFSIRYSPPGFLFDSKGAKGFTQYIYEVLAILNSKVAQKYLDILSPTIDFKVGDIIQIPFKLSFVDEYVINSSKRCVSISKTDWDFHETSWDFATHPLRQVEVHRGTLQESCNLLFSYLQGMTEEMQKLEQENNRLFIEAYGLQEELTPDVPFNEITLNCNPYYRYGNNKTDGELEALMLSDTIREYISYAVGCMFGRYSLDKEGLVFAGGGFDPNQYPTFPADSDNVIPILADDYFKDDIVARFVDFVKMTFSEENLDENLDFIAEVLGRKSSETARDTIRRYFINDFYKDHVQMYKKRPIYWMFTSGKEKAFNCLVYLHRYQPDTAATMRTEYLHRLQEAMEVKRKNLQRTMTEEAGSSAARNASRLLPKMEKQIQELSKYDELVHHYADMRINLDLDDGVKINYAKLQELLAKI